MCAVTDRSASSGGGDWPKPGRSTACPSTSPASASISSAQFWVEPPSPCTNTAGGSPSRSGRSAATCRGHPGTTRSSSRRAPGSEGMTVSGISPSPLLMPTMLRPDELPATHHLVVFCSYLRCQFPTTVPPYFLSTTWGAQDYRQVG